jgi:ABC-2 type transport system ATP-binding protein
VRRVLSAEGLGKRYGSQWALRDCSIDFGEGQVIALVGPNGAGKSTLLEIAAGLISPTVGRITVLGLDPRKNAAELLPKIGFMAQDHPLYRGFSIEDMLTFGRKLNPNWDDGLAARSLGLLGLQRTKKVGQLSGGQQAQLALVIALAKQSELLLLDEPVAALDPLARREFSQLLMGTVAETRLTVVLSSHIVGDLERVCDSIVLLSASRVQLAGQIDEVLASHRWAVGPVEEAGLAARLQSVVQESRSQRQVSMLVRLDCPLILSDSWAVHQPSLEDIVLGYLRMGHAQSRDPGLVEALGA